MTDSEKRHILLIVGVSTAILVMLAVAAVVLDVRSLVKVARPALQRGIEQPSFDEDVVNPDEFIIPQRVLMRGPIERSQTVVGTIGMSHIEGWVLEGRSGEVYLLDFEPMSGDYLWQMDVYRPDQQLLAFTADSDAGYADFTQLEIELPKDGAYTIVLSAFGMDGKYRLEVR